MKTTQPNFELVKTEFFNLARNTTKLDFLVLMENLNSVGFKPSFNTRLSIALKKLNKWLDTIDIRMVGKVIDVIIQNKGKLPSWIKNKQFVIDYNNKGSLDLIRKNYE